ncbi:MAG TPA: MFS transporter, partial [Myxococcales bacterium]
GGAMIGSPLAVNLMKYFGSPTSTGIIPTFLAMGAIYFVVMMFGVFTVRVPQKGWKPEGWEPKPASQQKLVTSANVNASEAIKTPQFWLVWMVLFLNVSAGIGVLQTASPIIQQTLGVSVAAAAGFVGLLSLFNMGGRFFWSTFSDKLGRKTTYNVYFILGGILYALVPTAAKMHSVPLFVLFVCVIISMYGGGFSTVPAYLKDLFGTLQVGAIHGRLLTAWSAAGIVGPLLINFMRDYQLAHGVALADSYNFTMYILVGFLIVGLVCNLAVTPVHERYHQRARQEVPSGGTRLATN